MSTRRTVLGKYNDGVTFGLRCSLPGFDALTDDSSLPGQFSFDSEWSDIAQIHQIGVATHDGSTPLSITTPFTDLGYKPFIEMRWKSGAVIYDDLFSPGGINKVGCNASILTNGLTLGAVSPSGAPAGPFAAYEMLFIVFRIACPIS